MDAVRTFSALILATFLATACTQGGPYRTNTNFTTTDQRCTFTQHVQGDELCTIQHHIYDDGNSDNKEEDSHYYLAFVEFDDQGWFNQVDYDRKDQTGRRQMDQLLKFLYSSDEDYLIFVFAHGWRHNASKCDENVACFRRTLERLDVLAREMGDTRTVMGVYVGWRGLSVSTQAMGMGFMELPSFWERKKTADRVGHGGVTELLVRLNDFRDTRNKDREADKTHLIITGHSFGGHVIHSALSQLLIKRAAEVKEFKDGQYLYGPAKSFGDLVILVNPAFEGTRYEPLHDIATNRCFPDGQRPTMLVVTSKADEATGTAFPIGQFLSTSWQRNQAPDVQDEAILYSVGHNDRYKTHDLVGKTPPEKAEEEECGCSFLRKTSEVAAKLIKDLRKHGQGPEDVLAPSFAELKQKHLSYDNEITMTATSSYTYGNPYLVISTDENLIPDHNQIYGEDFVKFLQRFYLYHIYLPTRNGGTVGSTCLTDPLKGQTSVP